MTYAIRRDNGDVLYFDAITSIEESYNAQITKHPLASGSYISDHTITDNKRFSLRAILSDADFNLNRPSEEGWQSITDKQFVNNTETAVPVKVTNEGAKWRSFLPEVVSQFTASTIPTVTVTPQSKVKTAHAVRFDLIDMFEKKESFTLVEYNTNLVSRAWPNVTMTSLSFAEDADTGDGLFPNIEMEQAVYTNVENVLIKIKTVPNKGRKTGTTTKTPTKPGDDAANEPTSNAKKTSSLKTATESIQSTPS
ncbi:hypothetical protein CNR37_00178 [Pseudomonas phage ventosus]|uniref:Dit-like phage tail protein N-terminal domain-containing protein n=1 Tax=Pseudomonas phage ventosus TaxID=2048980 RepID=A0A2H4P876_9CAUD|nr:hypothetical protein CNR37_00178 [Pseudomonas phage ventosus]